MEARTKIKDKTGFPVDYPIVTGLSDSWIPGIETVT